MTVRAGKQLSGTHARAAGDEGDRERPLSVSEFLAHVNALLSGQAVWVEGEVMDVRLSRGRYCYFDLKDAEALVHCFALQFRLHTPLEDGMTVRVWGVPNVYQRYGRFSLVVESVELAGEGTLRRAFELLKRQLESEGLFAPERKRALPRFPERIALVTSPDAAAYTDVLKVLRARRGGLDILVTPVVVQGSTAAEQIERAIVYLNDHVPILDALVLVRGGGSAEELQAFNDERVVRALARSRIPTIVGVGHERDVTLADLVADVRASTPSNAAELLTPTRNDLLGDLELLTSRLRTVVHDALSEREARVLRAVGLLRLSTRETLDRILHAIQQMSAVGRVMLMSLARHRQGVDARERLLRAAMTRARMAAAERLDVMERLLTTLHPEHVLARGYSITRDAQGRIVRDAAGVTPGVNIATRLHRGTLHSTITEIAWPEHRSTSRKRMKSSSGSSRRSKQATLI